MDEATENKWHFKKYERDGGPVKKRKKGNNSRERESIESNPRAFLYNQRDLRAKDTR